MSTGTVRCGGTQEAEAVLSVLDQPGLHEVSRASLDYIVNSASREKWGTGNLTAWRVHPEPGLRKNGRQRPTHPRVRAQPVIPALGRAIIV